MALLSASSSLPFSPKMLFIFLGMYFSSKVIKYRESCAVGHVLSETKAVLGALKHRMEVCVSL